MKKIAAFIIMMICLATSNALAADYSEAVGTHRLESCICVLRRLKPLIPKGFIFLVRW